MKTATIPSLRVTPELRDAAESVLKEGESLSSFVEESLKASVSRRRAQQAFIARGLAGRDSAHRTGRYIEAATVLKGLDSMLAEGRRKTKVRR